MSENQIKEAMEALLKRAAQEYPDLEMWHEAEALLRKATQELADLQMWEATVSAWLSEDQNCRLAFAKWMNEKMGIKREVS